MRQRPLRTAVHLTALIIPPVLILAACGSSPDTTVVTGASTTTTRSFSVQASLAPWHLVSPMSRAVVVESGSDLVLLGGLSASGTTTAGIFRIDPVSGQTTPIGSLAQPTHDAGGAVLGNATFVFGGGSSSVYRGVQEFQVGQPTRFSGNLPQPRADNAVAVLGGEAFVVGGYDGTNLVPDVVATNDGISFRVIAPLPEPVRYPAVAAVGRYLYVFGGERSGGERAGMPTAAIQRVNVASGAAEVVGQLPVPLGHAAAAVLGGQVLVMGGRSTSGATDSILRFDPGSGSLSNAGSLPVSVADAPTATFGGTVYLVGGEGVLSPITLSSVIEVRLA